MPLRSGPITMVKDYGIVETRAKQDGRNMTMVIGPLRKGKK